LVDFRGKFIYKGLSLDNVIMSELHFLGTGGSVATAERDNTSFLVKEGQELILVDCPGSVLQKIKKLDFNPLQISSILITHLHTDHVYGLPSFVHSLMLEDFLVRIYGSEETIDFSRQLLDMFHLLKKALKIQIEFISLKPGENAELTDSLEVQAFRVPHNSSSLAYHFFFRKSGKELIYSGDTPNDSLVFQEARAKDYLIHDCSAPSRFFQKYPSLYTMHTHSLELGKHSQEAGVKCLIPCHFFGELEFSLAEIEEEIRKNYKGKLIIPRDYEKMAL
jgi:ribonuclease Z